MVAKGRADGAKGAGRAAKFKKKADAVGKAANFYKTATAGAVVPAGLDEPDAAAPAVVAGSKEVPDVCKNMLKPYKGDLFGSGGDKAGGLAYLSRMHPDADPEKELRRKKTLALEKDDEKDKDTASAAANRVELSGEMQQHLRDKKRRFALSLATLSTKPHERAQLVSDGAIPALVTLSREPDVVTKMSCALALMNLAAERGLRHKLLEKGAAAAIVGLSKSKDKQIQANCAIALCNLLSLIHISEPTRPY